METLQEKPSPEKNNFVSTEASPRTKLSKFRIPCRLRNTVLLRMLVIVVSLILILVIGATVFSLSGKYSLLSRTQGASPNLTDLAAENSPSILEGMSSQEYVWKEGWIRYNGKIYEYNSDIMTFLIMGIDKLTPVEAAEDATDGGQSDSLFLAVANPDDKSIKIIAVNRDTMVDVYMYGFEQDGITPVVTTQITVQHGFGDGLEQSCEATVNAVSKLFYDLPISGYAAINMGAVGDLVDAVGGIDLYVLEDMTAFSKDWTEGAYIHLEGNPPATMFTFGISLFLKARETAWPDKNSF